MAVGEDVGVAVGVAVGVIVGVSVGVLVGVGVGVGVAVGVAVGVKVGVAVGVFVGVGPLRALTTSPAEPPLLFHKVAICECPPELTDPETERGFPVALTVVGDDHDVYGLLASVYLTVPPSINQATRLEELV